MSYIFAFDNLTIGDARELIAAAATGDMVMFLRVIEKCAPGTYDLPMRELSAVCAQFVSALNVFIHDTSTPDAMRLLRQAFKDRQDDL